MRDALEREYDSIVEKGTSTYRNNHRKIEAICVGFKEDIEKYSDRFDNETVEFSKKLLEKLYLKFQIYSKEEQNHSVSSIYCNFDFLEGHEFENWCANLLRCNQFYNVEVTQASGDQGVDIIAEKDEIRYAIQCKCYSSNVGNTPVQEVFAGKNMYHCQIGVVMTNRYFTKGAYELAQSTGVLLWDRDRILKMINLAE